MVTHFPLDQAFIVAIWLESVFYGILIPVFVSSVYVILHKRKLLERVNVPMLLAAILMFLLSTAHMGINVYRLLQGYVLDNTTPGGAVAFLYSLTEPTQKAKDAIYCTQSLLGDVLNIYRSWLVWNKNIWVVIFPIMLWFPTAVVGYYIPGYLFEASKWNDNVFTSNFRIYITIWYTLALVQNLITTSLIAIRLWYYERKAGPYRTGNFSLSPIIHIIVESASIYVAAQLVLLITFVSSDNAQYVLLEIITPIVGIVFCLIIVLTGLHAYHIRVAEGLPTSFASSGCSPVTTQ